MIFFGEPIANEETLRQWIDYHMSQGNFDAALLIHMMESLVLFMWAKKMIIKLPS